MKKCWLVALLVCSCAAFDLSAQEKVESEMGVVVAASDSADGSGNLEVMSFSTAGGDAMVFSQPLGLGSGSFSPGMMDQFGMLNNEQIQKELEIVGEQRDRYKNLQSEYNSRIKAKLDEMNKGGFDPARAKGLGEEIRTIKEQQAKDIEDLLLPHQVSRLKQIQLQQRMKAMGAANALGDKKIAEELGLNEEQLAKLKEKAKEISDELQKKFQKLRDEAQDSLLDELSSDQREKLNALIGDKFELEQTSPMPGRLRNRTEKRERTKDGD